MKAPVTSFFDYLKLDIKSQIEMAKTLSVDGFIVRGSEGRNLIQFTEDELNHLKSSFKKNEIIAVDPLLKTPHLNQPRELEKFKEELEKSADLAKSINSVYLIYKLPIFDDITKQKEDVLRIVTEHIAIIKKRKLSVLIKQADKQPSTTYRYILEIIKDSKVQMIFEPAYLYAQGEAITAAFRILYDYVGMFIVDDKDPLMSSRLIGTGKYIDLYDVFKRFVKKEYGGWVVLDSGLIEQLFKTTKYNWFEKTLFKQKRHENKILYDFMQKHQNVDMSLIIKLQLAVLFLVFQNKKIKVD